MTPILVNDPFVALEEIVHFPPWEQFFDFPFPSYSRFCQKTWLTRQKVFPLPTVRALSALALALALSARALENIIFQFFFTDNDNDNGVKNDFVINYYVNL